jgi:hypothetical protein
MGWQEIGTLSEIIGSIAVVVSLIYLAIQIRDSAKASRSAAVTDATGGIQLWYQELGSNPATAELFLNGMADPDALSKRDQFQFVMLVHSIFLGFQRSYFLGKAGTLDIGLRDSIGTAVHAVNNQPGIHFYWRERKIFFQPEFAEWVEQLLSRQPVSQMQRFFAQEPG